jgi:hypothetical protein
MYITGTTKKSEDLRAVTTISEDLRTVTTISEALRAVTTKITVFWNMKCEVHLQNLLTDIFLCHENRGGNIFLQNENSNLRRQ